MKLKAVSFGLALSSAAVGLLLSQARGGIVSQNGRVERIKVHGKSLEGNLAGDSPDRNVSIYFPPEYDITVRSAFLLSISCTAARIQTRGGTDPAPRRDFRSQERLCRQARIGL